ncbi:hypothetical protein, partial [uncultured Gammaproteobacteria bacterium]
MVSLMMFTLMVMLIQALMLNFGCNKRLLCF